MIFLIAFLPLIAISMAQRPTYAGLSPKGYPELASRFKDDQDQNITDTSVAVGNRLGEGDEPPPQNIPTDARGDASLVNRLNQWPRENRPFWLLNSQQIEKHRHPDGSRSNQQEIQRNFQAQEKFAQNRQGFAGVQQVNGNQQSVLGSQPTSGQTGQFQSRFGEPVVSESRTIRPVSQKSSFVSTQI